MGQANMTKTTIFAIGNLIRRPEWMVFLPAITLAAFWLGGESVLAVTAICVPVAFALAGSFHLRQDQKAGLGTSALSLHNHVVERLDAILRDIPFTGKVTACLVLQFDGADKLLDRHGRAAEMTTAPGCRGRQWNGFVGPKSATCGRA